MVCTVDGLGAGEKVGSVVGTGTRSREGVRMLRWMPGMLRLMRKSYLWEKGRRIDEGCLIWNVMMSSNFWHIDKLDSEVKKIRERFDSESCATNCICILGYFKFLFRAIRGVIRTCVWWEVNKPHERHGFYFVRMPKDSSSCSFWGSFDKRTV